MKLPSRFRSSVIHITVKGVRTGLKEWGLGPPLLQDRDGPHIIEQKHHGSIQVESRKGQGTCFIIHLPINQN